MNLTRTIQLFTLAALIFASSPAGGETAGGTTVSGSNTAKLEYYRSFGDQNSSPYAYPYGQFYNEMDLNLSQRLSAYENWRMQASGLYNDSKYRSTETDLILERFKFSWEKGDGDIPFRMNAGDVYGYFSYRTLQRSFKGGEFEFQPDWFGMDNSLVIVTGAQGGSWGYMDISEEVSSGASWLVSSPDLGVFATNWVRTAKEADASTGQPSLDQNVLSLTGEKELNWLGQQLRLEGEAAYFTGDHTDTNGTGSGQDHEDTGVFFQLGGRGATPLTYRARYENYGKDFRPSGAGITADHEAGEMRLGWRFPVGLSLNGRAQFYTDDQESANPVDTTTFGLNLSASLGKWVQGLSGNMDIYHQDVERQDLTTDQRTDNLDLNLSLPLSAVWNGSLGLLYRNTDDLVAGGTSDSTTREARATVSRAFAVGGWDGSVVPGLAARIMETPTGDDRTLVPTLTASAARGAHRVNYNFTMNHYDRNGTGTEDLSTVSHGLRYTYAQKIDSLTLEVRNDYRNPETNDTTDAFYAGITWVRSFEGLDTLLALPFTQGVRKARKTETRRSAGDPAALFFGIAPMMTKSDARHRLENAEAGQPMAMAGYDVYELRLLREFDQRQRLAVAYRKNAVREVALLMDLETLGGPDTMGQVYAQVKKTLVERFGGPDVDVEKGKFGLNLAGALFSDTFVRLSEWHSRQGILRFGIPRRLDGEVRIEIRLSPEFPPPAVTTWSIEAVR
ncbi:MAG: hypothetical protein JEZ11_25955 [Desulfobacterales bacterium]|nr:hypothetical protein [Desulfobacterales bacterium]